MVDDTWELFLHFPHTVRQINAVLQLQTLTASGHIQNWGGGENRAMAASFLGLPARDGLRQSKSKSKIQSF